MRSCNLDAVKYAHPIHIHPIYILSCNRDTTIRRVSAVSTTVCRVSAVSKFLCYSRIQLLCLLSHGVYTHRRCMSLSFIQVSIAALYHCRTTSMTRPKTWTLVKRRNEQPVGGFNAQATLFSKATAMGVCSIRELVNTNAHAHCLKYRWTNLKKLRFVRLSNCAWASLKSCVSLEAHRRTESLSALSFLLKCRF